MAKALLVVRAEIPDPADRSPFDDWYQREHLPDFCATFRPDRAWRTWSRTEPSSHCAFYEFPDLESAEAVLASDALKPLIKDFDRVRGPPRVTRTREIVEVVKCVAR
jgi:hypothetical protein